MSPHAYRREGARSATYRGLLAGLAAARSGQITAAASVTVAVADRPSASLTHPAMTRAPVTCLCGGAQRNALDQNQLLRDGPARQLCVAWTTAELASRSFKLLA